MDERPSPPRRFLARAHLLVPAALTALFAFRAGGFFPLITGVGALALCIALVLRVTLAGRPFAGWSLPAGVAALAGAGLASWTLASALWSHAPERALVEFDRVLLYTALLVLMAIAPRRRGDLSIVLRWVLAAFVAACLVGLASRLAPDLFPISSHFRAQRLSFPLTYWNAMGIACALATVLALHHGSARDEPRWAQIAATGALPVTAGALYFTFSRGGIAACILGLVAYVAFAPSRRLLFTLAAAAVPVGLAVWACWSAALLATPEYFKGGGPGEGHRLALVLAACAVAAAVLRAALAPLERRTLRRRLPQLSRTTIAGLAVLALLLGGSGVVIAGVPGKVRQEARTFAEGGLYFETGDARQRLLQATSNGRPDLWRTSLDSFAAQPLHGTGAGTFRLDWEQHRPYVVQIADGHSLYLEVLGELGAVGGVLLAVLLAVPLVVAAGRLRGPERQAYGAFLAAALVLLVHAAVDWDWEMPVLFAWFFGAGGLLLARDADRPAAGRIGGDLGRVPRIVAALGCLLLALTPALVAASQARLDSAAAAFRRGDCATAINQALGALEVLPRAGAHEIVGYCDLRAGQNTLALKAMEAARRRDPGNWQYLYGLAIARALSRQDPRAAANAALRRNPQEQTARELAAAMASPSARARARAAAGATIPGE